MNTHRLVCILIMGP